MRPVKTFARVKSNEMLFSDETLHACSPSWNALVVRETLAPSYTAGLPECSRLYAEERPHWVRELYQLSSDVPLSSSSVFRALQLSDWVFSQDASTNLLNKVELLPLEARRAAVHLWLLACLLVANQIEEEPIKSHERLLEELQLSWFLSTEKQVKLEGLWDCVAALVIAPGAPLTDYNADAVLSMLWSMYQTVEPEGELLEIRRRWRDMIRLALLVEQQRGALFTVHNSFQLALAVFCLLFPCTEEAQGDWKRACGAPFLQEVVAVLRVQGAADPVNRLCRQVFAWLDSVRPPFLEIPLERLFQAKAAGSAWNLPFTMV